MSSGTYNKKVAELQKLNADDGQGAQAREKALDEQIAALKADRDELAARLADTTTKLTTATDERDSLRKKLDDTTALAGELKTRLEKLGQNVEKLTSEKGQLDKSLADAKVRLEELRRQKAAAEERLATWRGLVAKLRSMIDAGQLQVVIRNGHMLVALPNDVLFDSGRSDIRPAGQATLTKVAQVLAAIPDRQYLVAGHTDNVPISTARFPSNWELSTARAVEVTKLLVKAGIKPERVAAAGYGEFDPVATNDTDEHRARNRRIEIVLEPNLSELPSLEEFMVHAATP